MKRTTTTIILLLIAVATATLLAAERSTIQYKGMSVREPAPYGEAGLAWQNNFKSLADRIGPCKFDATTAPTAGDDTTAGYATGSLWYDSTANRLYWCASATAGAAVWIEVSPADLSGTYQPLNANLTTWAGVASSADGRAIVSAADYPAMRGLLGLGTMATQAADAVAITGGVISGIADLAVADGGTGASDAAGARANLGLAIGADVQSHSANLDTWAGVLPSANGQSLVSAVDYAAMRGLLDLEPGTDVQAYSSRLGAIAALTPTDGNLIVGNGTTWVTQSGETARTTLGLGTLATQGAGAVAITGGSITGITDLAVADGGTGASDAAGARTNLGLGSIATQAANSVAITGGAIDGTAIGATTPGTGKFTTLETGEHSILSDTVGLKLDAAGSTTLYSNGVYLRTNKAFYCPSILAGNFVLSASLGWYNYSPLHARIFIDSTQQLGGARKVYVSSGSDQFTDGQISLEVDGAQRAVIDATGIAIPSDTVGLKLDAAGTTTLISNGTVATLSKPLKAAGYQSADGTAGLSQTIAIVDKVDVTHTLVFKDGLLTNYSTAP